MGILLTDSAAGAPVLDNCCVQREWGYFLGFVRTEISLPSFSGPICALLMPPCMLCYLAYPSWAWPTADLVVILNCVILNARGRVVSQVIRVRCATQLALCRLAAGLAMSTGLACNPPMQYSSTHHEPFCLCLALQSRTASTATDRCCHFVSLLTLYPTCTACTHQSS